MIYVTGDMIVDEYLYGETTRISPEAPVPIVDLISREKRWGGCGNVYSNINAIQDDTKIACYYDGANEHLFTLDKHKNNYLKIAKIPRKTRIMSNGRYMSRIDDEEYITSDFLEMGIGKHWNTTKNDIVVLSDYNKGSIKNPKQFIQNTKGKVLVDPKVSLDSYDGAYLIKPNLKEFEGYVGKSSSPKELMAKAQLTRDHLNLTYLVITMSEDGVLLIGDTVEHYDSIVEEVNDVTGAGDVFMAGLALGLDRGLSISQSTRVANVLAGISVARIGTYTITQDDWNKAVEELL
jgi:D-beta-D-heptose 7-phosphate kinase/D-beta-D-heptose 1-phosphate adenosyltransferase